jgi:ubiquinone/menaquinone biosynthesis C-methylase UbiE
MPLRVDPDQAEVRALRRAADWRAKQVLEIGCGDGRLTLRLAALGPKHIEACDPNSKLIRQARRVLPRRLAKRVNYWVGSAQKLDVSANEFDLVVFSWVL